MSTKASSTSTSGEENNTDHNLDFVKVPGKAVANVRNNDYDNPQEHIYSVQFKIKRTQTETIVQAVRCSCPGDKYHEGPCTHRKGANKNTKLLAEMLLAHEQAH